MGYLNPRLLSTLATAIAIFGAVAIIYRYTPPYIVHPTCTYRSIYRIETTVSYRGNEYTGDAVRQHGISRKYIQSMNYAGCKSYRGTVIPIRTKEDDLLLLPTGMCREAEDEMLKTGTVDVIRACGQEWHYRTGGVIIHGIDEPREWEGFRVGNQKEMRDIRLAIRRITATQVWQAPYDRLETIAPSFLDTQFEKPDPRNIDEKGLWPPSMLHIHRWYEKDKKYKYHARYRD